jgi:predicted aspartyl protease
MISIGIEELRKRFAYDPATGILTHKIGPRAGHRAGWVNATTGYVHVRVRGAVLQAHRVVWAIYYGAWPTLEVDHIDGMQGNNRILNLRQATSAQNKRNTRTYKNNKLGVKGVDALRGKFRAQIRVNGKNVHLGLFDTLAEAAAVYRKTAHHYFGEFARVA